MADTAVGGDGQRRPEHPEGAGLVDRDFELVRELLERRGSGAVNGVVTGFVLVASAALVDGSLACYVASPRYTPYWVDRGLLETAMDDYRGFGTGVQSHPGGGK